MEKRTRAREHGCASLTSFNELLDPIQLYPQRTRRYKEAARDGYVNSLLNVVTNVNE